RWRLDTPPVREMHIPAHNFTLNHFAYSPDKQYLLTVSRDKTIKLWQASDLKLLKVIDYARNEGHRHSVNKIKWLRADNSVISCGDDRQLFRWKISIDVP
ncbi:MAG: WD40 repeat domain-containing protein, partial [Bacteroidota bacterium]